MCRRPALEEHVHCSVRCLAMVVVTVPLLQQITWETRKMPIIVFSSSWSGYDGFAESGGRLQVDQGVVRSLPDDTCY